LMNVDTLEGSLLYRLKVSKKSPLFWKIDL
jgi:hypothetical protein